MTSPSTWPSGRLAECGSGAASEPASADDWLRSYAVAGAVGVHSPTESGAVEPHAAADARQLSDELHPGRHRPEAVARALERRVDVLDLQRAREAAVELHPLAVVRNVARGDRGGGGQVDVACGAEVDAILAHALDR